MIYNSVSSAVVAALAAGEKGAAKGQAWQKLYKSAEEKGGCLASLGGSNGGFDRAQVDYWLSARLHHLLIPRHWNALNAKYGTNKTKRLHGISAIAPMIASPAPQLFIYKAVTAWAVPKLKGARRQGPRSVVVDIPLDAPEWRSERLVNAALAAEQAERVKSEALAEDLIVLPASFYDMNTWDLDAAPESTRRRWRLDINEKLDGMINDALEEARTILEVEDLIAR